MKQFTSHYKKIKYKFYTTSLVCVGIWTILFFPNIKKIDMSGDNVYVVRLNGEEVGVVSDKNDAKSALRKARKKLAGDGDELVMAKSKLSFTGKHAVWQAVDDEKELSSKMLDVLNRNKKSTLQRCFTIKINEFSINVASMEDVQTILEAAMSKYDSDKKFAPELVTDPDREVNVLTAKINTTEIIKKREEQANSLFPKAGVALALENPEFEGETDFKSMDFSDYELGIQDMKFGDKVEIVEAYLPTYEISDTKTAIESVTKDQEKNQIYEVRSGDTLGAIAMKYNLSLKDLIAMNESLENENSMIRVGDELTVTVPQPELSIIHTELQCYEEDYDEKTKYVDNDSWFTNKSVVVQEKQTGHHRVVNLNTYQNDSKIENETIKEEVTKKAIPLIVERGTLVPPTYIKPISGGRLSSGFGRRNRPTRGASSFHKGIDWATPVGTAVMASSGGTVARAGWASGYGYCIYINHSDGKQTRYGHLSRVLVSVGQRVRQGEKIALSGNTGVSTGAHLHFEILVNGTQVNPFSIL